MSNVLGESLLNIKEKLDDISPFLSSQLKQLDNNGIRWFEFDSKKQKLINDGAANKAVNINVGGKHFQTSLLTILNNADTLFFNLIMTDQWDPSEELFVDRNYSYFNLVLSFLRNGKVSISSFKDEEIENIIFEARYYHLNLMVKYLETYCKEVKFVSFEFSGEYRSGDQVAGTNNIEDLNNLEDTSCMKGICTGYPGWLTIELSRDVEFEQLEIGGYRGNTNLYASSNGSGASIKTSTDKENWTTVGTIHTSYATSVYLHPLTLSKARYIKFEHNSYIGIGYLKVLPIKK